MHEIIKEVAKRFDISINSYTKIKAAFLLHTGKGSMILKKQASQKEEICANAAVADTLNNRGFNSIEQYQTAGGNPYIIIGEGIYTLVKCGEGISCDFTDITQTLSIAASLARLHTAATGLNVKATVDVKQVSKSYYETRIAEMHHIKKWLNKQGSLSDVDIIFIKNYANYLNKAKQSSNAIMSYINLNETQLCLNEIREDNILIDRACAVTFINLERFALSLPPIDLCELIRRYIKRSGDTSLVKKIIEAYAKERPISGKEYTFIQAYLSFPHKFFSISNNYYNSRRVYNNQRTYIRLKNCVMQQNKIYSLLNEIKQ